MNDNYAKNISFGDNELELLARLKNIEERLSNLESLMGSAATRKRIRDNAKGQFLPELDYFIYNTFLRREFRVGKRLPATNIARNRIKWVDEKARPPGFGWFGYAIRDLEAGTYELLVSKEQMDLELSGYGVHAVQDFRYLGTTVHSVNRFMRGMEEPFTGTTSLMRFNLKNDARSQLNINHSLIERETDPNQPNRIVSSEEMYRIVDRITHNPPAEWPLTWEVVMPSSEVNPDMQPNEIKLV